MNYERLKELRNYEGYTQQNLADYLCVERATYAGWESGKDITPLRRLHQIANQYKISMDYLTGLSDNDNKIKYNTVAELSVSKISDNLKKYRISNQLTQKDIAKILKTTQSNIHKYETGKSLITTMYALEFAKYFSCSLDELLCRKKEK